MSPRRGRLVGGGAPQVVAPQRWGICVPPPREQALAALSAALRGLPQARALDGVLL